MPALGEAPPSPRASNFDRGFLQADDAALSTRAYAAANENLMQTINSAHVNEAAHEHAQTGMRVEGVSCLGPGSLLYRFVQRADVSDNQYIASPWWFQASAVRRVLQAARSGHRDSQNPAVQAARMAALSETWLSSGANYLLAAKVAAAITVFWGSPRPVGMTSSAQKGASGLTPQLDVHDLEVVPDPRCVQFYVPGMKDKALASKAVRVKSRTKFKHSADLANGDVEVFLAKLL